MTQIHLYDTTLRDGTQREGISLSLEDKLKIARKLDEFGIHYIEGGWPGSNPKDIEFFKRVPSLNLQQAKVAAFGSTRRKNSRPQDDANLRLLIEANTPVITLVGKSWDLHVRDVLETSHEENLAMIGESVAYCKAQGREVIYDAEHFFDGYKANAEYAVATVQAAAVNGADCVVLCDTNGGTLPWEIEQIVTAVKQQLGETAVGIHTHDDGGCGVANSLAAIKAGAVHVQGTINGYGERVANANLCTIIPDLQLKMGYDCLPPEKLQGVNGRIPLRSRSGQPDPRRPLPLRRGQRLCPQRGHPRGRHAQKRRQLPAHRSPAGGQRAAQRRLRTVGAGQYRR
jgi:2-isopropylmalate synthase